MARPPTAAALATAHPRPPPRRRRRRHPAAAAPVRAAPRARRPHAGSRRPSSSPAASLEATARRRVPLAAAGRAKAIPTPTCRLADGPDRPLPHLDRRGRPGRATCASGCTASTSSRRGSWSRARTTRGDTNTRFGGASPSASRRTSRSSSSARSSARATATNARSEPRPPRSRADQVVRRSRAGRQGRRAGRPRLQRRRRAGLPLPVGISDLSVSPSSTSLWIGRGGDAGPAALIARTPLRFHANVNYYLDNSSNLYDFEQTRPPNTREVAMFAYGIAASRVRFGLGVDAPLERYTAPGPAAAVRRVPRRDRHRVAPTRRSRASPNDLNNRDQHWLTLGLRARVFQGLTLDAGVDVGLRSVGYEYGTPLPPYDLIFGLGYPFDTAAFGRRSSSRARSRRRPPPSMGTRGRHGQEQGGRQADRRGGRVVRGPAARARRHRSRRQLPERPAAARPGRHHRRRGRVRAGDGQGERRRGIGVHGRGRAGREGRQRQRPRQGRPIARGAPWPPPSASTDRTPSRRTPTRAARSRRCCRPVPTASASRRPATRARTCRSTWRRAQDRQLDVTLRPANADVTLTPQAIVLRVPIKFRSGAPKLAAAIKAELEAVADILVDHPEIKTLRIEAHWSGAGEGQGGRRRQEADGEAGRGDQGLPGREGRPGRPDRDGRGRGRGAAGPEPGPGEPGQEPPGRAGRRPA